MACLTVQNGNYAGETFDLIRPSTTIGCSTKAEICLLQEGVALDHARIAVADGIYILSDLRSGLATYVNGYPIQQAALRPGNQIRIGRVALEFSLRERREVEAVRAERDRGLRDEVTRVFNQQHFMATLEREVEFALPRNHPLTCVLFAVDDFADIERDLGREAGFEVLRAIADMIGEEVRSYDTLARLGPDRFALLLRGTALDNALVLAKRFKERFQGMKVEHMTREMSVSVSMGLGSLDRLGVRTAEDLVRQAGFFLDEAITRGGSFVASARGVQ